MTTLTCSSSQVSLPPATRDRYASSKSGGARGACRGGAAAAGWVSAESGAMPVVERDRRDLADTVIRSGKHIRCNRVILDTFLSIGSDKKDDQKSGTSAVPAEGAWSG